MIGLTQPASNWEEFRLQLPPKTADRIALAIYQYHGERRKIRTWCEYLDITDELEVVADIEKAELWLSENKQKIVESKGKQFFDQVEMSNRQSTGAEKSKAAIKIAHRESCESTLTEVTRAHKET